MADRSLIEGDEPLPRREEAPEWGYEEGEERAASPAGRNFAGGRGGGGGGRISVAERREIRPPAAASHGKRGSAGPRRGAGPSPPAGEQRRGAAR